MALRFLGVHFQQDTIGLPSLTGAEKQQTRHKNASSGGIHLQIIVLIMICMCAIRIRKQTMRRALQQKSCRGNLRGSILKTNTITSLRILFSPLRTSLSVRRFDPFLLSLSQRTCSFHSTLDSKITTSGHQITERWPRVHPKHFFR